MRPIKLTLENVNSFRHAQTIDFEALATGGNIFCIAGDTGSGKSTIFMAMLLALYKNASKSRDKLSDFINLSEEKATVVFDFEANGKIYTTKRTLAKKGLNTFALSCDGETLATGDEAFAKVTEIIGLELTEFTQVALLEQGKFDKFLDSTPAERTVTLGKLLSIERFKKLITVTNVMLSDVKHEMSIFEDRLNRMENEGKTKDGLKIAKATEKTSAAQVAELTERNRVFEGLIQSLSIKKRNHEERVRLEKNITVQEQAIVKTEAELKALIAQCESPDKQLTELARLEQSLQSAEKRIIELNEKTARLNRMRNDYVDYDNERKQLSTQLSASLSADIEKASSFILTHISEGDKCPVCGGVVTKTEARAKGEINGRMDKEKRLTAVEEKLNSLKELGKVLGADIKAIEEELKPFGNVSEKLKETRAKTLEINRNKTLRDGAERNLNAAQSALITLKKELSEKATDDYDEKKDAQTLAEAESCKQKLEAAQKAMITAQNNVVQIQKALAESEEFNKQLKVLQSREKELKIMQSLFDRGRFSEFVTEEYIKDFTVCASDIMNKLSGGNYTLEYRDKDFWIKDFLNENKERKVNTLSGGETFLASMSIAISIMRYISAGRSFDFFFLDEGFGTLHDEAVETVVSALRELAKEVTVGVISHVECLCERIQSRLTVLHATEDEGSRIIVG